MPRNQTVNQQQASAASSKKFAERVEKAKAAAQDEVDRRAEEQAKRNEEAEARMSASQPTPTQRENDLAKVGIDVSEKEDHGGEDEAESLERQMRSKQGLEYETRVARPRTSGRPKAKASKSSRKKSAKSSSASSGEASEA